MNCCARVDVVVRRKEERCVEAFRKFIALSPGWLGNSQVNCESILMVVIGGGLKILVSLMPLPYVVKLINRLFYPKQSR